MTTVHDNAHMSDEIHVTGLLEPKDEVTMIGHVKWRTFDADGKTVESGEVKNLVTTVGKNLAAALWSGAGTPPTHLACGSGATAEAVGQTALVAETGRAALDTRTSSGNVTTLVGTIPAGTATGTVNEIGLFNAAAAGTMTQRALTGTISKPALLGLQVTWTTTFS